MLRARIECRERRLLRFRLEQTVPSIWLDACGDLARSNQGEPIVGETVVKADLPDNVEVRTCLDPIVTNVN
jgi:hypothetical protein